MRWILALLLFVSTANANDWGLYASVDQTSFDILGLEEPEPQPTLADNLGPDRLVIMYADWCPNCPKVMQASLEGLAKMVGAHHGWTFGNTPDRMIQYVDADGSRDFTDSLESSLDGKLELPFIGKIEGNEVVRTWTSGSPDPLDQWTLGWLYKGVNERPAVKVRQVTTVKSTPVRSAASYPLRGGHWSVDGVMRPSKQYLVSHLSGGQHRGKFDRGYLDSLSHSELMSLHSDDHEGRVKWGSVTQASSAATTEKTRTVIRSQSVQPASSYCPSGNCPSRSYSRGTYRRR